MSSGSDMSFICVSSHLNIADENLGVEAAAKTALNLSEYDALVPSSAFRSLTNACAAMREIN